ncbi:MAG: hypothetical protein A7316_02515 [Candidatus Altiarchaeales archaeon WOR_SM1_86-2]|nr:MAG: hypothetical protein A7316_02515 [Candidatus Altiarchaeales archaeon WOR_SM1_86-2]ODS40253.1 MAG: hypothetical protein A7315_09085 [Candidatus Altiarchaeales archaeon WOR_SM1_79]
MENEVKILKALADETRITIVEFLKGKEKCVYEIIPITGKSQPTVSQHLKILREAGILKFRKGPLKEPVISKFKKRVGNREKYCYYYSVRDEKIFELIKNLKEVAGRV